MFLRRCFYHLALLALLTVACLAPGWAADNAALVTATNDFGFRLYAQLAKTDGGKNLFISPVSLNLALAMTYNGAHGSTQQAMAKTLGWDALSLAQVNDGYQSLTNTLCTADPKNARLLLANSLWLSKRDTFVPAFLQRNKRAYGAEMATVDFTDPRTMTRVNNWVSAQTAKKIPTIIHPGDFDGNTVLALLNALYFKGTWSKAFDKAQTTTGSFTKLDGTKQSVPMMHKTGGFSCYQDETLQVAKLPYGNGKLSLVILLPRDKKSPQDFAAQLTPANWQHWMQELHPCNDKDDSLALPRFKAEYSAELKNALSAMGMAEAFRPGADFTNMVQHGDIWIKLVRHKTAIEVNEAGTEAAAATEVVMAKLADSKAFRMTVDHPFIFAIVADDGTIVFLGSIVDPK